MATKKISLTGIKPTGTPHLGNYLGAIRPALELSKTYDTVYFIVDYHALTTVQNGAEMRANIYKIAATCSATSVCMPCVWHAAYWALLSTA